MKDRIEFLNEIFSCFQQLTQWIPYEMGLAFEYTTKAQILIEYLEVKDCGSTGGFDPKSPVIHNTGFKLYNRYLALVRKYNNEHDIKECCYFNLISLGIYFKKLSKLREKFNK